MNWSKRIILFSLYGREEGVPKHSIKQLALSNADDPVDAADNIRSLADGNFIYFEEGKCYLSKFGEEEIRSFSLNASRVLDKIAKELSSRVQKRIALKRSKTGIHFTYGDQLYMFRFNVVEIDDELMVKVGVPVLTKQGESTKMNDLLLQGSQLLKSDFISDFVNIYITLVDELTY